MDRWRSFALHLYTTSLNQGRRTITVNPQKILKMCKLSFIEPLRTFFYGGVIFMIYCEKADK